MPHETRKPNWTSASLGRTTLMRIAALLHEEAGIVINEDKASLVQSRLARRLRATGIADFESYLQHVGSPAGAEERRCMLRALTTNVTKFYREPHHLEDLRKNVLPAHEARVRAEGRLRIWSAACATGEEPYSIAMELCAYFPHVARHDVKILATDINSDVLDHAKSGTYPGRAIAAVPATRRQFFPEGADSAPEAEFRISTTVRNLVTFKHLNLLNKWPFHGPFDAIFCRNVMIYFDKATQASLFQKFAAVSAEGTRLYIGHSERMVGPAQSRFRSCGTTSYIFGPAETRASEGTQTKALRTSP